MASDRERRKRSDEQPATGAMKPMALRPQQLHNEPARQVLSSRIESRETPLVSFGDSSKPAVPVQERRFSFAQITETQSDLRRERAVSYQLRNIAVTPVQMQELRERRTVARDLGWVIPGHRIHIRS